MLASSILFKLIHSNSKSLLIFRTSFENNSLSLPRPKLSDEIISKIKLRLVLSINFGACSECSPVIQARERWELKFRILSSHRNMYDFNVNLRHCFGLPFAPRVLAVWTKFHHLTVFMTRPQTPVVPSKRNRAVHTQGAVCASREFRRCRRHIYEKARLSSIGPFCRFNGLNAASYCYSEY